MIKQLNAENKAELKRLHEELIGNRIETGISFLQNIFPDNLNREGFYLFCAGTGQGKTSLLLALAKELAKRNFKVLFITIEQSLPSLEDVLDVNDNFYYSIVDETHTGTIADLISNDEPFDFILYDYIASEVGNGTDLKWDALTNMAGLLSQYAIRHHAALITAAQADCKLQAAYRKDPAQLFETVEYISFAKHMVDKITGGAYLIPISRTGSICQYESYNFKNRNGSKPNTPVRFALNLKTKTLEEPLEEPFVWPMNH